ncbi:MAG TPA: hypothetical protein VLT45_12625 [Kofleriaceae bacterium]|nr:hypothetical protein [Kofleriaceae bacterium]
MDRVSAVVVPKCSAEILREGRELGRAEFGTWRDGARLACDACRRESDGAFENANGGAPDLDALGEVARELEIEHPIARVRFVCDGSNMARIADRFVPLRHTVANDTRKAVQARPVRDRGITDQAEPAREHRDEAEIEALPSVLVAARSDDERFRQQVHDACAATRTKHEPTGVREQQRVDAGALRVPPRIVRFDLLAAALRAVSGRAVQVEEHRVHRHAAFDAFVRGRIGNQAPLDSRARVRREVRVARVIHREQLGQAVISNASTGRVLRPAARPLPLCHEGKQRIGSERVFVHRLHRRSRMASATIWQQCATFHSASRVPS